MTISKGAEWGTTVERPADLRVAADDAELARLLTTPGEPVGVSGGDMFRTIGARPPGNRAELLALPVDLVDVVLDEDRCTTIVAHLVAHRSRRRGGPWRGPVLAVMNAEFIGEYDVAPRGHPNDGRVETLCADPALSVRERLQARHRMRTATHLPHPRIATRSVRSAEFAFTDVLRVIADGRDIGAARSISITVRPDAAMIHA